MRSPIDPVGISKAAYAIANTPTTQPHLSGVIPRSCCIRGPATEMHTRSTYVMIESKKSSTSTMCRDFMGAIMPELSPTRERKRKWGTEWILYGSSALRVRGGLPSRMLGVRAPLEFFHCTLPPEKLWSADPENSAGHKQFQVPAGYRAKTCYCPMV